MVEERVNGLRKGEGGTGELGLRVICARWRGWGMPSISHVTLTLEIHNIITLLGLGVFRQQQRSRDDWVNHQGLAH